jgi:PilX N-terminal
MRGSNERGAALFVVVLVVTLLTAIGAFAMHATSLAQLGSGYSRRAAAAFYLAEMAANVRVASIADDAQDFYAKGHHLPPSYDKALPDDCRDPAVSASPTTFCAVIDTLQTQDLANRSIAYLAADPEGFFGTMSRPDSPTNQSVMGNVRVEATDEAPAPIPPKGTNLATGKSKQVTLTVTGGLVPFGAPANLCTAPITRASETQRLRGFVTYATP